MRETWVPVVVDMCKNPKINTWRIIPLSKYVNNHGDRFRPIRIWQPGDSFQMAVAFMAFFYGGPILTTYPKSWDDPPSKQGLCAPERSSKLPRCGFSPPVRGHHGAVGLRLARCFFSETRVEGAEMDGYTPEQGNMAFSWKMTIFQ